MKAIYLLIGMVFIGPHLSNSQELKKQDSIKIEFPCYNTTLLFKELRETHREHPILLGTTEDAAKSKTSFWWQPITNEWTIVVTKDDLSCIMGFGKDLKIIPYKSGKSV